MLIIADDLTGAADSGVAFADENRHVNLVFGPHPTWWPRSAGSIGSAAAATAIDTGSRDADAAIARRDFIVLLETLAPDDEIFNKVDSMLRGHIRLQVETLYDWFPDRPIVVAPAFPRVGRVTRHGVQYIHDRPLHQAGTWTAEPADPPRSVPHLLGRLPQEHIGLQVVRPGGTALLSSFESAASARSIMVCDAETDQDLDKIVSAGRHCSLQAVWVGAGGLAAALARDHHRRRGRTPVWPATADVWSPPREPRGFCLTVVGSATDTARRQAHALAASQGAALVELPGDLLASADQAALQAASQRLLGHATHGDVVVRVAGPLARQSAAAIASALAAAVAPLVSSASVLAIVGGATARAIMNACGIDHLELVRELEPGVVLARTGRIARLDVITKAGAFGDEFTLIRALQSTGYRADSQAEEDQQ